ncbi:MAG: hypothetical protein ACJAQ0_000874 [Dasania sp.]|jgi:hypothetical protein
MQNSNITNRSDFYADQASITKKMDLLDSDKNLGITRNLKKITEEIVDSKKNIHAKTVTINETINMKNVSGQAEAVFLFDSANQRRSGKRMITLNDDGSASLEEIVQNFEISKYKAIANDRFSSKKRNTAISNNAISNNASKMKPIQNTIQASKISKIPLEATGSIKAKDMPSVIIKDIKDTSSLSNMNLIKQDIAMIKNANISHEKPNNIHQWL